MKPTISCIIPAFNEAPRIGEVLVTVASYSGFDEVVVVDDGSTDQTAQRARKFPVKVVQLPNNQGKSAAIRKGLQESRGQIIVLLDSDLQGLNHTNLDALVLPALNGRTMTVSLRANTWPIFHWEGVDPWSGERAIPRQILESVYQDNQMITKKYAIESYINGQVLRDKLKIVVVPWPNVRIVPKKNKEFGYWRGVFKGCKMFYEVYSSYGFLASILQQMQIPIAVRKSKRH